MKSKITNTKYSYFKGTAISLNSACNRSCKYCDISFKNRKNIKFASPEQIKSVLSKLKKYIPDIKNWAVCVEGGEAGLSDLKSMEALFNSGLKDKYSFYTNGIFIDKYYDIFKSQISYIGYHLDEEKILNNEKVKIYNLEIPMDYYLVLTKDTYKQLKKFIIEHKDLSYELRLEQPRLENSKIDFNLIQEVLEYYEDVREYIGDFFYSRLERALKFNKDNSLSEKQMLCSNFYRHFLIDIPNNEIHRCNISYTGDRVELNDENLEKAYKNDKIFDKYSEKCANCIALNVTRDLDINKNDFKYLIKAYKIIKD